VSRKSSEVDLMPTVLEFVSQMRSEKDAKKRARILLLEGGATAVAVEESETETSENVSTETPHLIWHATWIHNETRARPTIPNFEFSKN
jgi:hypothetical protein